MTTDILALPELSGSQANKYITHNEALRQLEARIVRVLSRTVTAQPGSPASGATYIIPAGATGTDWSTYTAGDIAHYYGGAWDHWTPVEGARVWVNDEDKLYVWSGSTWSVFFVAPRFPASAKTAAYTVQVSDLGLVFLVDASAGAVTLTLPDSATAGNGFAIGAVKTDASTNALTIDHAGTDTIKGDTALVLDRQWGSTLLATNGAGQWVEIGGGGGAALPIADDEDLFANAADLTKLLKFSLASFTTGTIRTATWPDKSGTVAMLSDITGGGLASAELDEDTATTTGLTWGYKAGLLRIGATLYDLSAGTVALTASTTNYVELDPADQIIKVNQTAFTVGRIPLRELVTDASAITTDTDRRAWIIGGQVFYTGLTQELPCLDQVVSRPEIKDYAETLTALSSSAGTLTLDLVNGNVFEVTLTENVTTLNLNNPPASGKAGSITLILKQDATGSRTVTWPASVKWAGGSAPTLSTDASATDVLTFVTTDAGTTWYGFLAGKGMA